LATPFFPWCDKFSSGRDKLRRATALACPLLKAESMKLYSDFSLESSAQQPLSFWERLAEKEELQGCEALEKLLIGCEIIAALDGVDLLAT